VSVHLVLARLEDAEALWQLQIICFAPLLKKYRDVQTNPAAEPLEKTMQRLQQPSRFFYWICLHGDRVGAISVRDLPEGGKKLGPLFVHPAHQGRGIAQQAILAAEALHGAHHWVLDTILQEPALCHLYEKMGYRRTGGLRAVNPNMTLVDYFKQ